jgi:hypothetical protein
LNFFLKIDVKGKFGCNFGIICVSLVISHRFKIKIGFSSENWIKGPMLNLERWEGKNALESILSFK